MEEVKMTRCLEECGKQWKPKQGKSEWQKQKEEEAKEEAGKKWEEREKQKETGKGKINKGEKSSRGMENLG